MGYARITAKWIFHAGVMIVTFKQLSSYEFGVNKVVRDLHLVNC